MFLLSPAGAGTMAMARIKRRTRCSSHFFICDGKIHHFPWLVINYLTTGPFSMSQNVNVYRRLYDFLKWWWYIYIFFSHRWWYLRWWSMGYVNIIFLVMINFYANFTGLRFSQWRSWWFGLRWSSPSGEINGDFVGWIHYWVELMETWGYLYFEKPTILYLYTYMYIYTFINWYINIDPGRYSRGWKIHFH